MIHHRISFGCAAAHISIDFTSSMPGDEDSSVDLPSTSRRPTGIHQVGGTNDGDELSG
jgi:hypothetical protein